MSHTTTSTTGPSVGFIRATIKIAHPDWTPEQIEAELQNKLNEMQSQSNDATCEFCSS